MRESLSMSRQSELYSNHRPFTEESEVYRGLRELLMQNRVAARFGAETLAELLRAERLMPRRVGAHEVAYALETLRAKGEV